MAELRSLTYSVTNVNGTSHTVDAPTGLVANDAILLYVGFEGSASITWPSGFSELHNQVGLFHRTAVAYKVASGSEPSSYTVTSGASTKSTVVAVACSSCDGSAPIDVSSATVDSTAEASPVTITADAITTSGPDRLLIFFGDVDPNTDNTVTGIAAPSGFTARLTVLQPESTWNPVIVADKLQAGAGSTGTITTTATLSSSDAGDAAFLVALKPFAGTVRVITPITAATM